MNVEFKTSKVSKTPREQIHKLQEKHAQPKGNMLKCCLIVAATYNAALSEYQSRRMFPDSSDLHDGNKNAEALDRMTKEAGELFTFLRKEQQKHKIQQKAEEEKKKIESMQHVVETKHKDTTKLRQDHQEQLVNKIHGQWTH